MDSVTSSALPTHGPDTSGTVDSALKIDMLVRPWLAPHREPHGSEGAWSPQTGLLALVEDIVAARRATFLLAEDLVYISGFRQAAEAVVAARQIQIAVQGFRRRHPDTPVAVSIGIDASRPSVPQAEAGAEPPHELVSLLRISKPAQVLLTHDAFQQVSDSAGLPLKAFPGRFGVQEYFWVGEDQLEVLKSEPQLTLAVIPREAPAPTPNSTQTPAAAIVSSATLSVPDSPTHLGRSTPQSEQALGSRGASLLRSPRIWLIAGVPLLVVALIVGILLSRGPSHAPAADSQAKTPAASPAAQTAPAPAPSMPVAEKPVSRPASSPTAAAKTPVAPKSKRQPRAADAAAVPAPVVPAAPSTPCVQRTDPAMLYSLAEQNRQRGHYADAEREFRDLLACNPDYPNARDHLDRTIQAEKLHPQ
ncbi:MAG: hypothetical protein ACLGXA_22485 [Acidobacteriota bacterium]